MDTGMGNSDGSIYRLAVENMKYGFAYFRMLYGTDGKPADSVFIDVNNAFERIIGLKKQQVIGRRAKEVCPEIFGSGPDWADIHGPIAAFGGKVEVSCYYEPMKKWYTLTSFGGDPGCFGMVFFDITHIRDAQYSIRESEEKFKVLTEQNILGLAVLQDGNVRYANRALADILEYTVEEMLAWTPDDLSKVINPEDRNLTLKQTGGIQPWDYANAFKLSFRIAAKSGVVKWVEVFLKNIYYEGSCANLVIAMDISGQKLAEEALINEKELFRVTIDSIFDGVIATDTRGNITIINGIAESLTGWSSAEVCGRPVDDVFNVIDENTREGSENAVRRVLRTGLPVFGDESTLLISRNGDERAVSESAAPIKDKDGCIFGVILVFRDVTEHRRRDNEVKYLSYHDKLTDLYNRAYFEKELERLDKEETFPVSFIIGDLNGLKLTNDVFGHMEGDRLLKKTAEILRGCCRQEDIIARWGGDEFAVILPDAALDTAMDVCNRIKHACSIAEDAPIKLSVALGYAARENAYTSMNLVIKEAEDWMYRHKLVDSKSMRSCIISSLQKTLFERSYETEEHAERLLDISIRIGQALGLSDNEIDELHLLSLLHDIGKIAISDSILLKPGKLTAEEWKEMRKHSEAGYRIAESSQELLHIADYILSHHERWDGSGYPRGLAGGDIPRLARILAVADAYDVMTHTRPYKQALSHKEAVEEIIRCSGSQFDPEVVEVFLKVMSD
jgi:diguanylate cyclase (GGDEF)-like protein/PAS domain S-box-containing protein